MLRAESHLRKTLTVAVAAAAVAAPAAQAGQDLRSPDTRDAGASVTYRDLRAPDTRDAAVVVRQDMRSPDARDAGLPVRHGGPRPVPAAAGRSGGFDWGDAGVGAGVIAALVLLGLTGTAAAHRRRRTTLIAG